MDATGESREIAALLVHAAEQLKSDFATAVGPFDLTVPSARALLLLDEPAPMRTLAARLACDQSYVTRIADDLESRGLMRRSPGADRRVQLLTLTEEGRRARTRLSAAVLKRNRVHHRLDAEDRAALRAILAKIDAI